MRRGLFVSCLLILSIVASEVRATPTTYMLSFVNQTPGSPGVTPTGSFTYDPDVPVFTNFVVAWNGRVYDLTSSANCSPCSTGSVGESFQLLAKTLPDGWFPGADHYGYFWNSGAYSVVLMPNTSVFSFGVWDQVLYAAGGSDNGVAAYGTWSIAPIGPISVTARITVDNAYALYFGTPDSVQLMGADMNWGNVETYVFGVGPDQYVYVAAWSDRGGAQGFLGQFDIGDRTVLTNTANWEVHFTGIQPAHVPTAAELVAELADADWQPVTHSVPHGSGPWGTLSAISPNAKWIWGTPLLSDFDQTAATEYHIYRYPIRQLFACELDLEDAQEEIAELQQQVSSMEAEIVRLNAALSEAQGQLSDLDAALVALVTSVQNNFRSTFVDPNFVLPGGGPLAQLENLVAVVTSPQRGSKLQVYTGLGGQPGKK